MMVWAVGMKPGRPRSSGAFHAVRLRTFGPILLALLLAFVGGISFAAQDQPPPLRVESQIGGTPSALAIDGSTLYMAIGTRVEALDVSQPARPSLAGVSVPLPDTVADMIAAN